MKTLSVTTPVGTFTRTTDSAYKFITVWASPRAADSAAIDRAQGRRGFGVSARWLKDNGYGVTWHSAQPNPKGGYKWDSKATLVGVFEVLPTL